MARTKGHGNPDWTYDEVVLALDLYFELNGQIRSAKDERVQALSALLRRFPHHEIASREISFRNADGVAFKLQNLRQIATGKGLGNVSQTDRLVWKELGLDIQRTKQLADLIKSAINATARETDPTEPDMEFAEGRLVTELHRRRERDPRLRKRLLATRKRKGGLCCDMCGIGPYIDDDDLRDAIFEAHHVIPLSTAMEGKTRLSDVALLCANCHRVMHRLISLKRRWLTIDEARRATETRARVEGRRP